MVERWVDEKTVVCAWNAPFEISWLVHFVPADTLRWVRWLDGALLWKHLENAPEYEVAQNKRRRFGLKEAVAKFFPQYAGYDEGVDFDGPLLPLMVYNAQDALFTRAITRHLYVRLEKHAQRLKAARIESHSLFDIGRANYEGFVIDPNGLDALDLTLKSEADAALSALAEHGATDKILASPKQLQKLMFDDWGLQPIKHGKTGPSTDQETLHELSALDDRVNNVRLFREAKNNRTKFVTNIGKSLEYNNDDRSHPLARVFAAYSGRMVYSSSQGKNKDKRQIGWALHQMKRDKDFRGLVRAPEGHAIIEFDAAGQEFRWMAELSGDETMLFLCEPGQDPHSYMGASVWRVPYDEVIEGNAAGDEFLCGVRRVGKVANLCVAADTQVLTDRGYVPIVEVTTQDRVWDGVEFVTHDGVVCSGTRPVLYYCGVAATPDHPVLVNGEWVRHDEAARYGWQIESALGAGWAGRVRASVWIVGGIIRRALSETWGALRQSALCVRQGARRKSADDGGREIEDVQGLCYSGASCSAGALDNIGQPRKAFTQTSERLVSKVQQPSVGILSQLRSAGHRVQVWLCSGGSRVHPAAPAARNVSRVGHRQDRQRWSLRAGKLAAGHSPRKSGEQTVEPVYDLINCGPRTRFTANGVIVHNSLQYRTSAKKLLSTARVKHGMAMTLPDAEKVHRTYRATYPGVPRYWRRQIDTIMRQRFVETLAGRRVTVSAAMICRAEWSVGSTSINFPIQGTGADQKYLALSVLRPIMQRHGAWFLFDLHDGIYFIVAEENKMAFIRDAWYALNNLPYEKAWGFTPRIPLPFDCKVGTSWGNMKELKYAEVYQTT